MNKTRIEWLRDPATGEAGYTINPVKGLCPMDCKNLEGKSYCYARLMYKRFRWNPEIRFEFERIIMPEKPSRIFVGSTMELFGSWIKPEWLELIFGAVRQHPEHTFIFLTKQPQNLIKWSPFPRNCWVGVSATDYKMFAFGLEYLQGLHAKVKFVSMEPMLARLNIPLLNEVLINCGINWLIIGSQTQPVRHPPREWVDEIINVADEAGIPVFVKEPMASHFNIQRKEFPAGVKSE